MSAIDAKGLESSLTTDSSTDETIESLIAVVERQQEQIDDQAERIDDQAERIDDQAERIDDLEQRLDDQQDQLDRQAKDRAETKQRVNNLEETDDTDETPTVDAGENTPQEPETTPIEQLSNSDDPDAVTSSASVKRAVSLFENIGKWGQKAPKGIVLKPADNPLSLLEADRDESLCWKQYYRAAKSLEQLSKGAITFFDSDRHGKMLVLHKQSELYDRITNGQLSPSSAQAPT
jgi:TolA-binding protein